jgi:hypothetical protein
MLDYQECVRRGAIGAAGAIPGTVAAHPFDVVKMRMQVTGAPLASTARQLLAGGAPALYGGLGAGVAQKVLTRGPMFLASEASTQCVMATGVRRERAVFLGSLGSGYLTGFCAASAEWVKVQRACGVAGPRSIGVLGMLRRPGGVQRLHGAGLRNACFDSIFFGSENWLRGFLPPGLSYGFAAALAVALDYPLDAAVKRLMAAPPEASVRGPLAETWALVRCRGWGAFNGLRAKGVEFFVSYCVTGLCSTHVVRAVSAVV